MLGLGLDVDIEVKKVSLPFHFDRKNECVHCGATNSLIFIDKFGNESRYEVKAFDHIKCNRCGRLYSILWNRDKDSDKMYPSAVDPSLSRDFMNMVNSNIKNNGVKTL